MHGKADKRVYVRCLLFFSFAILHTLLSVHLKTATIVPDELNTLGVSAWFAGENWSSSVAQYRNYYGYGQSLIYTPLIYFIKDGRRLFQAVIVANGLLMSFVPVIAYSILEKLAKNFRYNWAIAAAVGCMPVYYANSKHAWNESAIMLLTWVVWLLIVKLFCSPEDKKNKFRYSVLLGVVLGLGLVTHGRFYAVIATVLFFWLVLRVFFKQTAFHIVPTVSIVIIAIWGDGIIRKKLINAVWLLEDESQMRNTFTETLARAISEIAHWNTWKNYIRAAGGHYFYWGIASLGLVVIFGIMMYLLLVKLVKSKRKKTNASVSFTNDETLLLYLGIFLSIQLVLTLGMEMLFFTTEYVSRIEHYFIYGRYTEPLLGPMVMCALLYCIRHGFHGRKAYVLAYVMGILGAAWAYIAERKTLAAETVVKLNIYSLEAFSPWFTVEDGGKGLFCAIIIYLIVMAAIYWGLYKKKYAQSILLVTGVLLCMNGNIAFRDILPASDHMETETREIYDFFRNEEIYSLKQQGYSTVFLCQEHTHAIKIAIRDWDVLAFWNNTDYIPPNTFLIFPDSVSKDLGLDYSEVHVLQSRSEDNKYTICVYGSELWESINEE